MTTPSSAPPPPSSSSPSVCTHGDKKINKDRDKDRDKEGKDHFKYEKTLTFDDLLLVPNYSEVIPHEVNTQTCLVKDKDFYLQLPILSSAMDTVTEHRMAKVMAQLGGLGILHRNLSIEEQCREAKKVKKYESGMIHDPIVLGPEEKTLKAVTLMKKHAISGLPVVVEGKKLVGILTYRDLRFEKNTERPIKEIMTHTKLVTAPVGISVQDAKQLLQKHRIEKLPIVNKDGILQGLITIKDIEKSQNFPLASKDHRGRLRVGAAVGTDHHSKERVDGLVSAGVDVLIVDTAHGHSSKVLEMIRYIHAHFKEIILVGGNVVTAAGAKALFDAGADVVKVGVGSGSICTTRIVTGVGLPQASAILNSIPICNKRGKGLISDGGIKFSGDITKALALGAHAVMLGHLLAGTEESPGETIFYQGRTYKSYRGMGSLGAMHRGGARDRYAQEGRSSDKLVPEGIEGRVPYKGRVSQLIYQLKGGLQAGMGYLGAENLLDLRKNASFVAISPVGLKESHVHNVSITKEAPNYRLE